MESILTSIKELLGIRGECTDFDGQLIIHINTVLAVLTQLGVGPSDGFYIEDASALWEDFIENQAKWQAAKSYTYLKVRLIFDPPISAAAIESMNRQISEYEWRLCVMADSTENVTQ